MKTISQISEIRVRHSMRARFNPIKTLTPDSLSNMLDGFAAGYLKSAALTWDAIERRDDVIQGVAGKRKKSVSRLNWEILTTDGSDLAKSQKLALEYFYDNLTATHACDGNERGGLGLLVRQMMDAIGKKYAVHEMIFDPHTSARHGSDNSNNFQLTATFRFVPLWFFENHGGRLRFLANEGATEGVDLEPGAWLVTVGDGLMEACSIAYLFKHLPLRDWLVYCERNGMPGVKGVTDAPPNSTQWERARDAVEDFGAEFHALMSRGTDIEAIDLSSRGELPYPALIDRMDRAISALWRGSDLTTLSRQNGTGASLQADETTILEEDDAAMISETLNAQVDRFVIGYLFGNEDVRAYIHMIPSIRKNIRDEIALYKDLYNLGVPLALDDIRERFSLSTPTDSDVLLTKNGSATEAR
jgi:phage gp29-like protein